MDIPEKMTGAAHRAEVWAAIGRNLVTLLRLGEEQRTLHAPRAIKKVSKVGDQALGDVLRVVWEQERREVQELSRWKLVPVADAQDARRRRHG
jgi:hypothetical protein